MLHSSVVQSKINQYYAVTTFQTLNNVQIQMPFDVTLLANTVFGVLV